MHFLVPGARKPNRWTKRAKLLLEAFEMYDSSLCSGCGQSAIHSFEIANSREFTAEHRVCLGCQAKENFTANNEQIVKQAKGLKVLAVSSMGPQYEDD